MNQSYESHKNSDLDWLGDIPTHWKVKKLKYLTYMKGRIGWQNLRAEEFIDEGPYLITGMNFKEGKINWNEVYHISEERYDEAPEIQLSIDDVLMTKDGTIGKVLYIDYLPGKASLNSHLLVLRPLNKEYHPKYLYYQIDSNTFKHHIEVTKTGTTFFGITQESVGEYPMILPPLAEQRSIATYLDRKTAQIDDLVARKEKLLALLQQKRQAIINEAVTSGLDANAPTKDSGIEWLGEIPAHWEVKKLKYIASLKSGETITAETIDDEGEYPVYGGGGFRGYTSDFTHEGHYSLIGRQGALCGNINYAQGKFWASEHALVVSLLGEYETVWLGELLRSMNLNQYSQSSAQPGISADRIQNLHIPVPPLNEQRDIVEFILTKGKKIDQAVTDIKTQLAYFKTYRQSLISEVVTGKMDVRSKVTVDEQV